MHEFQCRFRPALGAPPRLARATAPLGTHASSHAPVAAAAWTSTPAGTLQPAQEGQGAHVDGAGRYAGRRPATSSMTTVPLHFHGPLTFSSGRDSLFHSPLAAEPCVYLWTVLSERDGQHYVHYIGEAEQFALRHRTHLTAILGLEYGIFDPIDAGRGVATRLWPGLWRDKSAGAPARAIEFYAANSATIAAYVRALRVFAAAVTGPKSTRRHIEGCIARSVRGKGPEAKALYPEDNRVGLRSGYAPIRLAITAESPIAGLDSVIEF